VVLFAMQITMINTIKNTKNKCQNLPHFGLKGLINPIKNDSIVCPGLENTCCSSEDFHGLKQWWELRDSKVFSDDIYLESKKSKRERQLVTVKSLTYRLLEKYSKFLIKAQSYAARSNIDEVCDEGYNDLKDLRQKFYEQIPHDYLESAYSCWSKVNKMQTSFLCSLCDPDASDFLEITKGFFGVSTRTCETVMSSCLGMVNMNTSIIIPYLSALNKVSRCNSEGKVQENLISYELNDKLISPEFIETCNTSGECEDLCENTLKIGGGLNNVLEGDLQFALGVYVNSMNWLEKRYEVKHVSKMLKQSQEEIRESIDKPANRRELYKVNKSHLSYYKKFRYDNKLNVQRSFDRPKNLYNRNDEVSLADNKNRVLQQAVSFENDKKSQEYMRPLSKYPGRYLILISEAEFHKRFNVDNGIPAGGKLFKNLPRKIQKTKKQEGRILKRDSAMYRGYLKNKIKNITQKKERILENQYERNDMDIQPLENETEKSETMTIAQKARQLREFEEKRGVIEEKATDILEWTQLFDNFIRRLKSKINVLSAGLKKIN